MIQNAVDTFFTILKSLEELAYPNAIILPGLPRIMQLNDFSCGPACVCSLLRYVDYQCELSAITSELRTGRDGTNVHKIKRVLRRKGLRLSEFSGVTVAQLRQAIDSGSPILISTHSGDHYSVVYGYSRSGFFVMNPSIGRLGSWSCFVPRNRFVRLWDRWGIVVSR